MGRFRERVRAPEVDAVPFDPMVAHRTQLPDGVLGCPSPGADNWGYEGCLFFVQHEGGALLPVNPGDWVVTTGDGRHSVMSHDIFEATYEAVSAEAEDS